MFNGNTEAQIIHVRNFEDDTLVKPTLNYADSSEVLDDLNIKASDLLQTNGVIWVKGPSDKIYINKWIHLHSDGKMGRRITLPNHPLQGKDSISFWCRSSLQ